MDSKTLHRLKRIDKLISRYQRQKISLLHRKESAPMDFRKARTRTLIQLGGLVEKSGLLEALDLKPGDDLQKDPDCLQSAAILMGALSDLRCTLNEEDADAQKMIWGERGKAVLGRGGRF